MKHYKIISLDIWDTVLRRRCHPDEIKLSTARFLYLAYYGKLREDYRDIHRLLLARISSERQIAAQHGLEMDDEYSIRDVFFNMLRDVLVEQKPIPEIVEQLYRYEWEMEAEMCYLDPQIVFTISQYGYERLGYISDFYAGHEFIDGLLEKAGFPLPISFRYVSCDYGVNKRSGRLFQKALAELDISPDEQLHIGDNHYSDVECPEKHGINSLHYMPGEETVKRRKRENYYSIEAGHTYQKIQKDLYLDSTVSGILAPFFTNFVVWIIEECLKRKIKKIYYFTREGEFFIRLHQAAAESGLFAGTSIPKAEILEVSRVATFAGSLRDVTLKELMRLWNQYSIQTMGAFAKSVAMEEETLALWLKKYEIPMDEPISYPWQDPRVQQLFEDEEFVAFFRNHMEEKRALLKEYLSQKQLFEENPEEVAIVDIGWRGSIQDNLCYVFPEHKFVGYYLALEQFLNEQPKNAEKYGFLNDQPYYQYILRIVAPIEMICNSPNGSTVGYERQADGAVRAIRKKEQAEDQIYENYTKDIQEKMCKYSAVICGEMKKHALLSTQLKFAVCEKFFSLLLDPHSHKELVHAFFQLCHNEEFGVGQFIDKRTKLRLGLMIRALVDKRARRALYDFLNGTSWPQGYFAKYHMSPVGRLYNKIIKRKLI